MTPEQKAAFDQSRLLANKKDFGRLALGLFAASPAAYPLEFAYAGVAESADGKADVLDVKGEGGLTARLFLHSETHLPLMLIWMDKEPLVMQMGGPGGGGIVAFGAGGGTARVVQAGPGGMSKEEREKFEADLDAWVADDLYEQTLLVDGERLREVNIDNPAYPDPGVDGTTAPSNKYLWPDDLALPTAHRTNAGVERALTENGRLTLTYSRGWGQGLLRGRNLNTPVDGVRPEPSLANVVGLVGDAESRSQSLTVSYTLAKFGWRRLFLGVNYTRAESLTNTAGGFATPAEGDDLENEWGPSPGDIRHRLGASLNMAPLKNLSFGLNLRAQSGMAYDVTTGHDDNGDGVFNDRPDGVTRNSARGDAQVELGGRLSYAIGFGTPRQTPGGGPTQIVFQAGGGGLAPGFGGGAEDKRHRLEFYVSGQNLLNRVNFTSYSFVMTSPFFAQPVAAAQPRKLQVGVRFGF